MTTSNTSRARATPPTPDTLRHLAYETGGNAAFFRQIADWITDPDFPRCRAFGPKQAARLRTCADAFDRHAESAIEMADRLEAATAADEQATADEGALEGVVGRLSLAAYLNGSAGETEDGEVGP